jgi:hypothetical protein
VTVDRSSSGGAGPAAGSAVLAHAAPFAISRPGVLIRWAELGIALLALAAGGYIFFSTLRMVLQCWTAVPYGDQWDNLILELDKLYWHTTPLDLPHWVFYQHNEHRIAVPRLIFVVDRFLFAMNNKFAFFCNVAIQVSLAALTICVALRTARRRIAESLWITGAVLALLFSAMQWENFLWGFQVQFFGVTLAAVATFAAVGPGPPSVTRLAAVIGLESVAAYTLASGMAVPFLAVPLAIWVGWPRRQIVILSVAAITLLASYLYGYETPTQLGNSANAIEQMREGLSYVLSYIGGPFGTAFQEAHARHPRNWGRLCGFIGVVSFVALAVGALRRRERDGPVPVLIAAALFVLGMALLTALGRLRFGDAQALSSRYSSAALMFWAALIVIATVRLGRHAAHLRVAGMAAMLPLLLGLAYYQTSFAGQGRAWTLPRLEATTALLANVDDPQALVRIYPVPAVPRDRAPMLREHHLSVFAEAWSGWLGTPLADHARLVDPAECRGGIDGIASVGTSDPKGWRANGWAWDAERRAVPPRVVIADAGGRVIGYGLSGFPKANGGAGGGWRGHFAVAPAVSVIAYALLDDGRTACPLGRWPASS